VPPVGESITQQHTPLSQRRMWCAKQITHLSYDSMLYRCAVCGAYRQSTEPVVHVPDMVMTIQFSLANSIFLLDQRCESFDVL